MEEHRMLMLLDGWCRGKNRKFNLDTPPPKCTHLRSENGFKWEDNHTVERHRHIHTQIC